MGVIFSEHPLSNIWTSFVLIMRQQLLFAITTSPIIHLVCPPLPHKKYKPFVFSFSWVLQWSHEELKTMLMQSFGGQTRCIIIRSKFFFLFIGQERTTWPPNNCLQIMVCSCAMPSNCANNILHMRKGNRAFLLLAIALAWKWQIASLPEDIH